MTTVLSKQEGNVLLDDTVSTSAMSSQATSPLPSIKRIRENEAERIEKSAYVARGGEAALWPWSPQPIVAKWPIPFLNVFTPFCTSTKAQSCGDTTMSYRKWPILVQSCVLFGSAEQSGNQTGYCFPYFLFVGYS